MTIEPWKLFDGKPPDRDQFRDLTRRDATAALKRFVAEIPARVEHLGRVAKQVPRLAGWDAAVTQANVESICWWFREEFPVVQFTPEERQAMPGEMTFTTDVDPGLAAKLAGHGWGPKFGIRRYEDLNHVAADFAVWIAETLRRMNPKLEWKKFETRSMCAERHGPVLVQEKRRVFQVLPEFAGSVVAVSHRQTTPAFVWRDVERWMRRASAE